jgi:hypothetical protein
MVSIAELQLNDAEEKPSEPLKECTKDAKIESSGPGTPDATDEQADAPSSVENGDLMEEERKQRAAEVTLALYMP